MVDHATSVVGIVLRILAVSSVTLVSPRFFLWSMRVAPARVPQADGQPLMRALRAFVVEDSPLIRENLVATLEEVASLCVVGTAEDEEGALRFLASSGSECDIAIVDIFLARGSGLGVLRALRDAG